MAETFTWTPSYSSNLTRQPRVLEAKFGDGYSLRMGDGINNNPQFWGIVFVERGATEMGNAEAFLAARGGHECFWWTPPGGSALLFVCKTWKRTYAGYDMHGLEATFEQVFVGSSYRALARCMESVGAVNGHVPGGIGSGS